MAHFVGRQPRKTMLHAEIGLPSLCGKRGRYRTRAGNRAGSERTCVPCLSLTTVPMCPRLQQAALLPFTTVVTNCSIFQEPLSMCVQVPCCRPSPRCPPPSRRRSWGTSTKWPLAWGPALRVARCGKARAYGAGLLTERKNGGQMAEINGNTIPDGIHYHRREEPFSISYHCSTMPRQALGIQR